MSRMARVKIPTTDLNENLSNKKGIETNLNPFEYLLASGTIPLSCL